MAAEKTTGWLFVLLGLVSWGYKGTVYFFDHHEIFRKKRTVPFSSPSYRVKIKTRGKRSG